MMTDLIQRLGMLSLTSSAVLLPLLLLSRRIQNRYTARTLYILWLLLAVRLLLPVDFTLPEPAVTIQVPEVTYTVPIPAPAAPAPAPAAVTPVAPAPVPPAAAPTITLGQVLSGVWLAGCALFLLWNGVGYLLSRRDLLKGAEETAGDQLLLASLWAGEHGRPAVLRTFRTGVPMSLGLFRPVVLLPGDLGEGRETEMVLRHELGHIHRRDLWYKFLLVLVNAVHWFNPVVWIMCRQAGRNLEYCCDDWVVAGRDADFRHSYGQVLLRHASGREKVPLYATRFGGGGLLKGRIMNLFIQKKTGPVLVCLTLCAAVLARMLVSCESARAEQRTLSAPEALDALEESVIVSDLELAFTIPENYPAPEDWKLQVSGRYDDGMSMAVHIVDSDGNQRWEAGETCRYPMDGYDLNKFSELKLYAWLPDGDGGELEKEVDLLPPEKWDAVRGNDILIDRDRGYSISLPAGWADLLDMDDREEDALFFTHRSSGKTLFVIQVVPAGEWEASQKSGRDPVNINLIRLGEGEDTVYVLGYPDGEQGVDQEYEDMLAQVPNLAANFLVLGQEQIEYGTGWQWPLPEHYRISAYFGERIHPLTGKTTSHNGIDIPAEAGTEVLAARGGTVTGIGWDGTLGNYVRLTHDGGVSTCYRQLQSSAVQMGENVEQGQVIGYVGTTGASTGPHLHLEFAVEGAGKDALDYYPGLAGRFYSGETPPQPTATPVPSAAPRPAAAPEPSPASEPAPSAAGETTVTGVNSGGGKNI